MRGFFAVEVPEPARRRVGELSESLSQRHPSVRWVRDESLHITLRFLGEVAAGRIGDLVAGVFRAGSPGPPFTVALEGAGCFPAKGPPRIVWIGVGTGGDRLAGLFRHLEGVLPRWGFAPEKRPFSPHLTIGRIRGRPDSGLRTGVDAYRDRHWDEFRVGEFLLMESRLSPAGAVYAAVERFPLPASPGPRE